MWRQHSVLENRSSIREIRTALSKEPWSEEPAEPWPAQSLPGGAWTEELIDSWGYLCTRIDGFLWHVARFDGVSREMRAAFRGDVDTTLSADVAKSMSRGDTIGVLDAAAAADHSELVKRLLVDGRVPCTRYIARCSLRWRSATTTWSTRSSRTGQSKRALSTILYSAKRRTLGTRLCSTKSRVTRSVCVHPFVWSGFWPTRPRAIETVGAF